MSSFDFIKNNFYQNKKVLVTGHTGFKGSWLCRMLLHAGAVVTGYSLQPPTNPNLFSMADIENKMKSVLGDIRDLEHLQTVFTQTQPDIVFHLAAQPIVRESYKDPRYTYETNVMGTVNVLECIRHCQSVKSFLNVTTDKVYLNQERAEGYREEEPLDGFDPYSNSKSCSELATHCYQNSFFADGHVAVSTARAGNVIGGGDFAKDRILPDCVRAVQEGRVIEVRNPSSVRPYQHVLEPLAVYLMIAAKQYEDIRYAGYYNVGPDDCDCITTGELADLFCKYWNRGVVTERKETFASINEIKNVERSAGADRLCDAKWIGKAERNAGTDRLCEAKWTGKAERSAPHEANFLKLNCNLLKKTFGWQPRWHIEDAVLQTCEFSKIWLRGGNIPEEMDKEIELFLQRS